MALTFSFDDAPAGRIVALVAGLFLSSCGGEDPAPLDTTKPDLRVDAPVLSASTLVYHPGDTLFIKGQVSDLHGLHQVKVELARQGSTPETKVIDWQLTEAQITGKTVPLDQMYVFRDAAFTSYVLRIQATDHSDNVAYQAQNIQVIP